METFFFLFYIVFAIVCLCIVVTVVLIVHSHFKRKQKKAKPKPELNEFEEHGFKPSQRLRAQTAGTSKPKTANAFDLQCDHCGAKLSNASAISPHGDVKCEYCNKWFNVKV